MSIERENGVLWEGPCEIVVEHGAVVGESHLRIYGAGIELRDASAVSYLTRFFDESAVDEAFHNHTPNTTTIPFKKVILRADQSAADVIVIDCDSGRIEFRSIERAPLVKDLLQLLINIQTNTTTDSQKAIWSSYEETGISPLTLFECHDAFLRLKETVRMSPLNDDLKRVFFNDEQIYGAGLLQPPRNAFFYRPQRADGGSTRETLWRRKAVSLDKYRPDTKRVSAIVSITASFLCIEITDKSEDQTIMLYPLEYMLSFSMSTVSPAAVNIRLIDGNPSQANLSEVLVMCVDLQTRQTESEKRRVGLLFCETLVDTWLMKCYESADFGERRMGRNSLLNLLRRFHCHFASLDDAKEGFVRRKRFEQAMRPLLQSRDFGNYVFRGLTLGCDAGEPIVLFQTFLKGLGASVFGGVEQKLKFSFKLFDVNEDGTLDQREFVEALKLFHEINPFFLEQTQFPGSAADKQKHGVEEFAIKLFKQETERRTVVDMDEEEKLTFEQYKSCILNSTRDFGDVQLGSRLGSSGESKDSAIEEKKKGTPGASRFIFFGNEDFELASRILQGITTSVLGHDLTNPSEISTFRNTTYEVAQAAGTSSARRDTAAKLLASLQAARDVVRTFNLSKNGDEQTPPFFFTDYAPVLFRLLRLQFGIGRTEYLKSLGIDHMVFNLLFGSLCTLKQMSSTGSSGSIFFISHDERFIVKSLPKREFEVLLRILPDYVLHVYRHPDTLITQYCGLYSMSMNGKELHVVSMVNTFMNSNNIRQVYDLKGSTVNRSIGKKGRAKGGLVSMKDMDLNRVVHLRWDLRQRLLWQMRTDTAFLEQHGLIDYSLLIGFTTPRVNTDIPPESLLVNKALKSLKVSDKISKKSWTPSCCTRPNSSHGMKVTETDGLPDEVELVYTQSRPAEQNVSTPMFKPSVFKQHKGGVLTKDGAEVVQFGLIDILTYYDTAKVVEHRLKRLLDARMRMSCVPAPQYRNRMLNFLEHVFTDNNDTTTLLRLPSFVPPPGGRFRAVSEAGVLVDLVLGANPPTFWVVTTVGARKDVPGDAEETGIIRTKVSLQHVLFASPASTSVYSVGGLAGAQERGEDEVPLTSRQKAGAHAHFVHPLMVTTCEHVLYPTVSTYLTDLETKYRIISLAVGLNATPTSAPPVDLRTGSSPMPDLTATPQSLSLRPGESSVAPATVASAGATFAFRIGFFGSENRQSRDASASLAAFVSSTLNNVDYGYFIAAGIYTGADNVQGGSRFHSQDSTDETHYAVQYLKAKLGHVYVMEALVGSDEGFLAVFVAYKKRGGLTVSKKASYGGVHCLLGEHYLTPFVVIVSADVSVNNEADIFQDTVRFVSSSLDLGSCVLEVVPLVLWVCPQPKSPHILTRVSTKPVLLNGKSPDLEPLDNGPRGANNFSRFKAMERLEDWAHNHQVFVLYKREMTATPNASEPYPGSKRPTISALFLEDEQVSSERFASERDDESEGTAAQGDRLDDTYGSACEPQTQAESSFDAAVADLGAPAFQISFAVKVRTLDSFRPSAPLSTSQVNLNQSFGNFSMGNFLTASKAVSQRVPGSTSALVPEREVTLCFKDVVLKRSAQEDATGVDVGGRTLLILGNEFVKGGDVVLYPQEVGDGGAEGVIVSWGDFTVCLGNQLAPSALSAGPGAGGYYTDFLLSKRLVVTLCSAHEVCKPRGNWVYRTLQGTVKVSSADTFSVTLYGSGIASGCTLSGRITRK